MTEEEEKIEALNDIWFDEGEDPFDFTPLSEIVGRLKSEAVEMLKEEMEMIQQDMAEAARVFSAKPPDIAAVIAVGKKMENWFMLFLMGAKGERQQRMLAQLAEVRQLQARNFEKARKILEKAAAVTKAGEAAR